MSVTILNRKINRVLIVDDDPAVRDSYAYPVEDLKLEPVLFEGPVGTPESFIAGVEPSDVVVCDYHLKKHSYARCDGDELVAECYKARIPGMLCTAYTDVTIRRDYRRYIPALLKTNGPELDEFVDAWKKCLSEIKGTFHPTRRPWRTLVRVDEIDDDQACFYAVVPAWDSRKKVRIDNAGIPENILKRSQPGKRFHAKVNIGAESHEDLFFVSWESE